MKKTYNPDSQGYISKLANPKLLLRAWLVLAILELGALLLGVAFFIIVHGVIFGVAWLAPYWKPAFIAFTKVLRIKDIEFVPMPFRWWHLITLTIKIGLVFCFFYFGMRFFLTKGFLDQNLIYLVSR